MSFVTLITMHTTEEIRVMFNLDGGFTEEDEVGSFFRLHHDFYDVIYM